MPRVIHVVESLDRGATESWLLRMLRFAAESGTTLDWTFYSALGRPGERDAEARALGARVVHSPVPLRKTFEFVRALRAELRTGGYDVLHAHHDLVSGVYLLAGAGLPLRRRIVHVHNAVDGVPTPSRLKRSVLRFGLRRICLLLADRIVGVSAHALDNFLQGKPRQSGRDVVVYCGVEPPSAEPRQDRGELLEQLGWKPESRVMVFAGRMVPEKEPLFALEVIARMREIEPRVTGLFLGDGPLSDALRELAKSRGLVESLRQLGWRSDAVALMSCCDCFIQPGPESPPEGLGLAVVEAQLAGLHLLFSRGIPEDALLPGASYRRVLLSAGAAAWAASGIELLSLAKPSAEDAMEAYRHSPFEMKNALARLLSLYE